MAKRRNERTYHVPPKLLNRFEREVDSCGWFRERAVQAGMLMFLDARITRRYEAIDRLHEFLNGKEETEEEEE